MVCGGVTINYKAIESIEKQREALPKRERRDEHNTTLEDIFKSFIVNRS